MASSSPVAMICATVSDIASTAMAKKFVQSATVQAKWEDADDGIADGYGDDHEYVGYGVSLNYDIALVQCRAV